MRGSESRSIPAGPKGADPPKRFFCLFFFFSLLFPWGATARTVQAEQGGEADLISRARACFEASRYDEALALAKKAEEKDPDRPALLFLLGRIYLAQATGIRELTGFAGYFRRDLLGEAEEYFRKALRRAPSNGEIGNHLAFTLVLLHNLPAARDQARAVLEKDPRNAYASYLLGEIDLLEERPGTAAKRFESALSMDPGMADARKGLVRALTESGKREEAAVALMELARRQPDDPDLVNLSYGIYESADRLDEAVRLYETLLDLLPRRTDLRFRMGAVYYRLGKYEKADACFEAILRVDPEQEGALYYRGLRLLREKRYDEAAEAFQHAARREGDFFSACLDALHRIALTLAGLGKYDDALRLFDRVLSLNPSDTTVLFNKALTLSKAGLTDRADEAFKELVERDPWDSSFVNNFALHLMGSGRTKKGLAMLEKAAAMDGNVDALENLGSYFYYRAGRPDKADPYFLRVLAVAPTRTKSLVLHALIHAEAPGGD